MTRHARPAAELQRAQLVRHAADALCLVAMLAVILAAVLVYGVEPGETRQTEQMYPAQIDGEPLEIEGLNP